MTTTLYTDIKTLVTNKNLRAETPPRRLTVEDLGIIESAAFLVEDEKIRWVGKAKDAPSCKTVKKLQASLVLPGFVDAHTHLIFAGERSEEFRQRVTGTSYESIGQSGGGILTTTKATRAATAEELLQSARKRLKTSARFGITTLEIKSGYALNESGERKMLEVATLLQRESHQKIIRTYMGAHAFPPDMSQDEYMTFLKTSLLSWFKAGLYDHLDMFTEKNYFSLEQSEELILLAKKNKIPFKLHVDELNPLGGARFAATHGALSADHLLHSLEGAPEAQTINLFQKSKTVAVFLPGTAFFLKLKYANPQPFLEAGIPVALATDFNPGSCTSQNLPFMMTLACLYMGMNMEEALAGVTIQAARALALNDVGHLSENARADFQVYDVPYSQLVYEFAQPLVREVFARNQLIYKQN